MVPVKMSAVAHAGAMRARIRAWRETYLRWGSDTLGFGLYLRQEPA